MANLHSSRQLSFADDNNDKESISVTILEVFESKINQQKLSILFFLLNRHLIHHHHPMVFIYGHVHRYLHSIFGTIEMILSAKIFSK
jgi:hypothetical protein